MPLAVISVPNRVDGSEGLPALTRVGNPEGALEDGQGWENFTATDHLSGFRLWDAAALPDAADYRTLIFKFRHKTGAPASSGNFEYLLSRPANAAANNYGGLDIYLRDTDLESVVVRGYIRDNPTNFIAGGATPWPRGTTWWLFVIVRDPTAGVPQVEVRGYEEGDPDRLPNLNSTHPHSAQIQWAPDQGDHFIGFSPHGGSLSPLDNAIILEIGLYDGELTADLQADIADGTQEPTTLAGMLTWYNGKLTTIPPEPVVPKQSYEQIAVDRWGEDLVLPGLATWHGPPSRGPASSSGPTACSP